MSAALLGALVGSVLGSAGTLALYRTAAPVAPEVRAPVVQPQRGDSGGGVSAVAEAVSPSVVRVDRLAVSRVSGGPTPSGLGSGVIYRSDGYIITNNHVVEDADQLEVKFATGESMPARVVGADRLSDIAVLRVDRASLPAVNVRKDPIVVGELAVAIGSPFGLDASVTAGVVSAVNRSIQVPISNGAISIPNVIQTDAAINPGNSGGALADANGRLIGINSAILSAGGGALGGTPGNVGVGFAISAQDAVAVADKLIQQGFVRHARLGIRAGDLNSSVARQFGLNVNEGALISDVDAGGPAEKAGIRAGDVIVAADGKPISSMDKLTALIREREPGDKMSLTIVRDGQRLQVDAVLGEWQA